MSDNKQFNNDGVDITAQDFQEHEEHHSPPTPPKKRKFPWIKAAVLLIAAGAIFLGMGLASGARGGYISWAGGNLTFNVNNADEIYSQIALADVTNIEIATGSASITVVRANSFLLEFIGIEPDYSIENGHLTIDYRPSFSGFQVLSFGLTNSRQEIIVHLPRDIIYNLDLTTSSGRITVEGVELYDAELRTSSGRLLMDNVIVQNLETRTSSGRMRLDNVTAQNLNARTSSGRFTAENLMAQNAHVRSSSGALRIDGLEFGSIGIESSSGSIRVQNARSNGPGEANLRASSGSIRFEIADRAEDYGYILTSSSGSIRFNGERLRDGGNILGGPGSISAHTNSGSIRITSLH